MNFKYQATTRLIRQELQGHLYRSTKDREPSEPQSIALGASG